MGQIIRCPLLGVPCSKRITIEEKTIFLAEAEEPEYDRQRRSKAIKEAIGGQYKIISALDEDGINTFNCKTCELIQSSAYGIADITQNNANVLLELGVMLALGKSAIVLLKDGQELPLNLPPDIKSIEVIPFGEYLDILEPLRNTIGKLPPPLSPSLPIEELEKIEPQLAEELRKVGAGVVKEFAEVIRQAKLETISLRDEKKEMPIELGERLGRLDGKLDELAKLGFTTDADTAFLRANLYYNQGRYNEALAAYNLSLDFNADDPVALYNRGTTYYKLGDYEEALADYNRSLELRPDNAATFYSRGSVYDELGRHEEALADYNRSLECRPNHPDTLCNRGTAYDELGMYEEALADYNKSLELRPDHATTLCNRGTIYARLGRHEEALADYNKSLELRPDYPTTLYDRGITYARLGRHEEALADCIRSLELKPDDPAILYNLACLFALRRNTKDAVAYLEEAIEKNEKYRQMAKTDEDFDNIREDVRFKKLVVFDYFWGDNEGK
jgi:tetratricopeptide (TPR) repeat protein